jgi:hypothetical protein
MPNHVNTSYLNPFVSNAHAVGSTAGLANYATTAALINSLDSRFSVFTLALNTAGEPFPLRRAANGEIKMNAQATKLQAAENDLKQLMADVTRAVEKAQEAVARIASKAGATTEMESTTSSR